jgi:hypothetical protein
VGRACSGPDFMATCTCSLMMSAVAPHPIEFTSNYKEVVPARQAEDLVVVRR